MAKSVNLGSVMEGGFEIAVGLFMCERDAHGRKFDATSYNKIHHNYISAPSLTYGRAFATMASQEGLCSYNEFYQNYVFNTSVRTQIGGDHNKIYNNIFDTMWN